MSIAKRMKSGDFLVSVQIDPPNSADVAECKEIIGMLMKAGVSLVDVNSSRRISHDSIQLAASLAQLGLETIPHVTTRDSSINGLLNQILAAYSWHNLRNFLVITGDPYEASQAIVPSRGVFQTDSIGALRAFREHLRENPKLELELTLGAAVNQNEKDLALEGERIRQKEEAGADFFMSQPVFSQEQVRQLLEFYDAHCSKPLMVGIWPLMNGKTVENIYQGRIVGVAMPEGVYKRAVLRAGDSEKFREWGMNRALQLIEYVRRSGRAEGVYIVAPSRNPLLLAPLIEKIEL